MEKLLKKKSNFSLEALETRQLLSAPPAPWSVQAQQIGQDQAAANFPNITGAGTAIAIIDGGVDYHHPALGGSFGPGNKVEAGWNFIENNGDPYPVDANWHGTGEAAMAASTGWVYNGTFSSGTAPGANIVAIRANTNQDQYALQWIINNAATYHIVAIDATGQYLHGSRGQLQELANMGIYVVAPSGNDGPNTTFTPTAGVVGVGSTDPGNTITYNTRRGPGLNFVAPGNELQVPWIQDGQETEVIGSGSSWSAAEVAGIAADIKQINSGFSDAQITQILTQTSTPIYDSVTNQSYNQVNMNAAFAEAYSLSATLRRSRRARKAAKAAVAAKAARRAERHTVSVDNVTAESNNVAAGSVFASGTTGGEASVLPVNTGLDLLSQEGIF